MANDLDYHVRGLQETDAASFEHIVAYLVIQSFSKECREQWDRFEGVSTNPPVLSHIQQSSLRLSGREDDDQSSYTFSGTNCKPTAGPKRAKVSQTRSRDNKARSQEARSQENKSICSICKGEEHKAFQCQTFKDKTPTQRSQLVRELYLCFNCLSSGHSATQCCNPGRCRSCGRLHHSLLHEESPAPVTEAARNNAVITKNSSSRVLATSMADIRSEHASRFGRLFLDTGSEATLITKKMAKLLRAPLSSRHLDILGVAGGAVKSTYITQVQLQSINYPSEEPVTIQCHIVDELPKVNPLVPELFGRARKNLIFHRFIFLTRCWLGKPHSNHISLNRPRVWDSPHFLIEKIE